MIVHFTTCVDFVFDPFKAPFENGTFYWFDNVQYVSFRPGTFKFAVSNSFVGSIGTDTSLDVSEFLIDPKDTIYELDLDHIDNISVDGVNIWDLRDY